MSAKPTTVCENTLLATLSPQAFAALEPHLEHVEMPLKKYFSRRAKPAQHAYFPCSGVFSLVQELSDGVMIEVGLIGREGFLGVPLLLGAKASPLEAMVQGPGVALRMSVKTFHKITEENITFRKRLLLYAQALHIQVTQTAACNGRHTVKQRLARWLLEANDRIRERQMKLSHEFLSYMLGIRRAGVSVALQEMRKAGHILSGHGNVIIVNRQGLEATACECYKTVQRECKRLLA